MPRTTAPHVRPRPAARALDATALAQVHGGAMDAGSLAILAARGASKQAPSGP